MPAEPDLANDIVVELEDGVLKRRGRLGSLEIEEDPARILEPLLTVDRFGVELDAHTNPVGQRQPLDLLDRGDRARCWRRR
jgi:hypothetical protein